MGRRLFLIRRNLLSVNRNTKEIRMKAREELLKEIGALKREHKLEPLRFVRWNLRVSCLKLRLS